MTSGKALRSFDPAALADLRSNVRVTDVATTPVLTPDECDALIDACDPDGWWHATRSGYTSAEALAGAEPVRFVDPEGKRRLEQNVPGGEDGAFMRKIAERALAVNEEVFGFRVVGFETPTRLLRYRGTHDDHVHEHIDVGPLHPLRKLGFSVLLSDPTDFEGGDLQFSGRAFELARSKGTLTMFPSFIPHLVTPTTRGTRYVVVGWILGPSFV